MKSDCSFNSIVSSGIRSVTVLITQSHSTLSFTWIHRLKGIKDPLSPMTLARIACCLIFLCFQAFWLKFVAPGASSSNNGGFVQSSAIRQGNQSYVIPPAPVRILIINSKTVFNDGRQNLNFNFNSNRLKNYNEMH